MSGVLAQRYDPAREVAYFGILGAVAILVGVVVLLMSPRISTADGRGSPTAGQDIGEQRRLDVAARAR